MEKNLDKPGINGKEFTLKLTEDFYNEEKRKEIVQELVEAINAEFTMIDIHGNKIIKATIKS